jgi:hypothetical protein
MTRSFQLVDVFHDGAFSGNPLAVVLDADDLSLSAMQATWGLGWGAHRNAIFGSLHGIAPGMVRTCTVGAGVIRRSASRSDPKD